MSGAAEKQCSGAGTPAAAEKAAAGGDAGPEPPPPPSMLSVDVTGLVSQFARSFVLIFPVYVLGYLGLSFSWVLIALCGLFWIRRHRGGKTSRLGRALAFLEDEEEAVRLSVSSADLPAWVSERGRERAADTLRLFRGGSEPGGHRGCGAAWGLGPFCGQRLAAGMLYPGGTSCAVRCWASPGASLRPASRPRRRQPEPGAAPWPDSRQGFPRSVNFTAGIRALPADVVSSP